MKFSTLIELRLKGHGHKLPVVTYGIDNITIGSIEVLDTQIRFNQEFDLGSHTIFLEFNNKTNDHPDMAVEIIEVKYEEFDLDRFKWANKYYPNYPEPWASEQTLPLPLFQESATYLGWNGRIEFEFQIPIYTWIHKLENLGWIYP